LGHGKSDSTALREQGGESVKAAVYARVSTTDQNCELQLNELREYIVRHGWENAGEYVDTGWSGAKASRPEFDKLMEDARKRRFDVVLVWKLDRFGRSLLNCKTALQQLQSNGVRFIATSQNIDTDESNPAARFLLHMLMAAAEFERVDPGKGSGGTETLPPRLWRRKGGQGNPQPFREESSGGRAQAGV